MRITSRVMVTILSISIAIMFIGMLLFAWFFIDHALETEQQTLSERLTAAEAFLGEQETLYRVMAKEYAEGYEILYDAYGHNRRWADRYLDRIDLSDIDAHFMLILDENEAMVADRYQPQADSPPTALPPAMRQALSRSVESDDAANSQALYWKRSGEVYRVGSATLSHTDGHPVGRFLVGRRLDSDYVRRLENFSQAPLVLQGRYPENYDSFVSQNGYATYLSSPLTAATLQGVLTLQEEPLVALRLSMPRDVFQQQRLSLMVFLTAFFLFITGIVLLFTHMTNQKFLRPIETLSETIAGIDPQKDRRIEMKAHGSHELHILTATINELLATIHAEKAQLTESEKYLRTLFEQSPLGIVISRVGRRIERVNPAFCRIVGYDKEMLEKMTFDDLHHPEEKNLKFADFNPLAQNIDERYQLERRYVRRDGRTIWIQMTVTRLDDLPVEATQFLCLIEDISERKAQMAALSESERSKDVLLQNLPGMAYRCSPDATFDMVFVSQGSQKLTGYSAGELTSGQFSYRDLILAKERREVARLWQEAIVSRQTFQAEYPIRTASGEIKWVYEQGVAVDDEQGNLAALEGLIIDVTTRKKHEQRIEYLNQCDVLTGLYNRRYYEKALIAHDKKRYLPFSIMIGDINGLKLANDAFGHATGDHLIRTAATLLKENCREGDIVARTGGDEFTLLLPHTDETAAYELMQHIKAQVRRYNRRSRDQDLSISLALGFATRESMQQSLPEIIDIAEDYMRKHKLLESRSSQSSVIASIVATLNERSQETDEHAERLARISHSIGLRLSLSQIDLDKLVLLARLHDIGKINIDNAILNKPDTLSPEEWTEMRKHPEIGYRIATASPELMSIADMILCHHERWDGNGYPQGLAGENIPILSRIMTIADAFDAMVQDRPYRQAISVEDALLEIERCAGSQFDPQIAAIFVAMMRDKKEGAQDTNSARS